MALPLPSPQRDFAPVTHDTNRIGEVITELNALGTHPGTDGHSGIYSPSALQYYLETSNGDGTNLMQSLPNAVWTTIDVAGTVATNNGGGFNSTTDIYTLPAGGIYICTALLRVIDGFGTNCNLGIGIGTANADAAHVQWNKYVTGSGGRCAFSYLRAASFASGNQLRLYAFQDSGVSMTLTRVALAIWRIG